VVDVAAVHVGARILRIERDRLVVIGEGAAIVVLQMIRSPAIEEGVLADGVEPDCLIEVGDGTGIVAAHLIGEPAIVEHGGEVFAGKNARLDDLSTRAHAQAWRDIPLAFASMQIFLGQRPTRGKEQDIGQAERREHAKQLICCTQHLSPTKLS
jgi:hypothetical protein